MTLPDPPTMSWPWFALSVAVPVVISACALVVSWRAFDDQHAADAAAAVTARQQYAQQVDAWLTGWNGYGGYASTYGDLVVANLGSLPASDVLVTVVAKTESEQVAAIQVGTVPPCSLVTVDLDAEYKWLGTTGVVSRYVVPGFLGINQLVFYVDGRFWSRGVAGVLQASSWTQQDNSWVPVTPRALRVTSARGCS